MSVPIVLDKPRTLKFDIRATRDLEAAMGGKPLGSVLADITNFGVTAITAALWAGLKHEDAGLNQTLTVKLFDEHVKGKKGVRVVIKALSDALEETGLFASEEDEAPEGNGKPEAVGT